MILSTHKLQTYEFVNIEVIVNVCRKTAGVKKAK